MQEYIQEIWFLCIGKFTKFANRKGVIPFPRLQVGYKTHHLHPTCDLYFCIGINIYHFWSFSGGFFSSALKISDTAYSHYYLDCLQPWLWLPLKTPPPSPATAHSSRCMHTCTHAPHRCRHMLTKDIAGHDWMQL